MRTSSPHSLTLRNPDHTDLVEWYVEMYGGSPADFVPAQVDVEALDKAVRLVAG